MDASRKKRKLDNFYYDLKFMRKFHYSWYKEKEKVELKLEEWKEMCDITMNERMNDVCMKQMNAKDAFKMQKCIV